jgi:CspA family cold shock protein
MTGTIKRMVSDKGFGFIAAGDGTEYFFHQSACTSTRFDDMREGQTVSFTVGQGPKGPRAENVNPARTDRRSGATRRSASKPARSAERRPKLRGRPSAG